MDGEEDLHGEGTRRVSMESLDPDDSLPDEVRIAKEGISRVAFFLGTLLALFLPFIIGRYPQHGWLVLLAGYVVLIPLWYYHVVVHRRGHWYPVEVCWVSSLGIAAYFGLIWSQELNEEQREWGFRCVFMFSAGCLGSGAMAANHALVFYSIEHMANIFIQLAPLVALLAMRSRGGGFSTRLQTAWPGYFPTSVWEDTEISQLLVAAFVPYLLWLVLYTIWLLTAGVNLAARDYATVFSDVYQQRVRRAFVQSTGRSEIRYHAMFYLLANICFASVAFFWALVVWYSIIAHVAWIAVLLCYYAWRGGDHYLSVTVRKFGPMVKRRIHAEGKAKQLAKAARETQKFLESRPVGQGASKGAIELLEGQGLAPRMGPPQSSTPVAMSESERFR